MKNTGAIQPACTLSVKGEERLLRATLASEFLAGVLSVCGSYGHKTIPAEGAAAILACLAEQLDGVVRETSTIKGNDHD
ncbi:hypothetical protein FND52_05480 [Atlantibacter subterranea]|uniref:hypothetical protein n=1 Tax=Atlantibacter subterraneus TaxID=255519 RepID=UPI0011820C8E|nr:hypothetical protein [Atlantibacter subterranea]TSJ58795.1 hypothetical protein FND52_05480 [Atlantibacter subterranea]